MGKKVDAFTTYGNTKPEYVVDGIKDDDSKRWISTANGNAGVIIDLGGLYKVESVVIYSGENNGTSKFVTSVSVECMEGYYGKTESINSYRYVYYLKGKPEVSNLWIWFTSNTTNRIYEIEVYGERVK